MSLGAKKRPWQNKCQVSSALWSANSVIPYKWCRVNVLKSARINPVTAFTVLVLLLNRYCGYCSTCLCYCIFLWCLNPVKSRKIQSLVETEPQDWFTDDRKGELLALVTLEELMLVFVEVFIELTHQKSCHTGFFQGTQHKNLQKGPIKRLTHLCLQRKRLLLVVILEAWSLKRSLNNITSALPLQVPLVQNSMTRKSYKELA